MNKAVTLGTNAKGDWIVLQSPEVPIGDQYAKFHEANLGDLPKGVASLSLIVFEDSLVSKTLGAKTAKLEREAAEKRALEKRDIQEHKNPELKKARLAREAEAAKAAKE